MKKLIIIILLLIPVFAQAQNDTTIKVCNMEIYKNTSLIRTMRYNNYKCLLDKGLVDESYEVRILPKTFVDLDGEDWIKFKLKSDWYDYKPSLIIGEQTIQFITDDKGNVFLKIIRGDEIITYRLILNENLKFTRE